MPLSKLDLAACVTLSLSLLVRAALPAGIVSERNLDFLHSAAGIEGRVQVLRQLERQMLAHAANPERAVIYEQKRAQARRRLDELVPGTRAAIQTDAEHKRLEQLAAQIKRADRRMEQMQAAIAEVRGQVPLAAHAQ